MNQLIPEGPPQLAAISGFTPHSADTISIMNDPRIHKQKLPLNPHFMPQDIKYPEKMIVAQPNTYWNFQEY
jgi:hypothetical protein